MIDIVVATRNPGKLLEISQLLSNLPVRSVSVTSFEDAPDVVEDAPDLEGNAVKKARVVARHVDLPALADDTGLEVRTLGGRPGVLSARYAGPSEDASANRALLLDELRDATDRSARFRTVLAFVDGVDTHLFEGVCEGHIALEERGAGGFGYDALFIPDGETRTFAELPLEAKNRISHRGRALHHLRSFLETWLTDRLAESLRPPFSST